MADVNSFQSALANVSQQQTEDDISTSSTNKHLTVAQMRGVVPLFNHYFKVYDDFGNRKNLNKQEKQQRWMSYKSKMWTQYRRVVKGSFTSEQTKIQRWSNPLSFLKYKLRRTTNLKVSELSQQNREYYKEIGELDDVALLIERQNDVDSLRKVRTVSRRKRQRDVDDLPPGLNMNNITNHNK